MDKTEKTLTIPGSLAAKGVNVTPFVVKKLEELAENGGGTLLFEKGEYHFYPQGTYNGFFAPCNNTSGSKQVCFPIIGGSDITVDGSGSLFIFHGRVFPFIVSESISVTLKNFTCDTCLSPAAVLEIIEKNDDGFLCRIDKGASPYTTKDGHLFFDREEYVVGTDDRKLSLHSLDRMKIIYLLAGDAPSVRTDNLAAPAIFTDAFDLGDRLYLRYRDTDTGIHCPYETGERVVINLGERRENALFFFENSQNVLVENVTIRRFGGMGFIAQLCSDIRICGVQTDKSAHSDLVTLTADAFHLVNCSGVFELARCNMESFLDDACNVHGVYTVVDSICGDTVHMRLGHEQQDFFSPFSESDRVRLIDPSNLEIVAEAVVKDVYICGADGLTLNASMDFLYGKDRVKEGFFVETPEKMPDILIHDNIFRDFPHIRLSGMGKITVNDNTISDCSKALVLYDLAAYWYESGRIKDADIYENSFVNCNELGGDSFIDISVSGFDRESAPKIHENISIHDNSFSKLRNFAVTAAGVKKIQVYGNTFDGNKQDEKRIHIKN